MKPIYSKPIGAASGNSVFPITTEDQALAKILIIGCGDIGYRLALALQGLGHQVCGLKRTPPQDTTPFPLIIADIRQAESLTRLSADFDAVVLIVSPGSRQAEAYQALYQTGLSNLMSHFAASARPVKWLLVSSSSVYPQNRGEWVDETSPAEPENPCSRWLAATERRLWTAGPQNCVVRFSGIYGPGRDRLLLQAAAGPSIQRDPPLYGNRIHRDDCVAVLLFLLERQLAGCLPHACYLASDDDPAPQWQVMNWLAEQYGYPPPPAVNSREDAPQNKRCSNRRLKALGYRFIHPGYRDGYLPQNRMLA